MGPRAGAGPLAVGVPAGPPLGPRLHRLTIGAVDCRLSRPLPRPPLALGPAAGPPGQLLGADHIWVAQLLRERLQPLAGGTVLLADADLLHRETLRSGCRDESRPELQSRLQSCSRCVITTWAASRSATSAGGHEG